jgi:serine phosphatase RsbU (regulator of sigma subunit)
MIDPSRPPAPTTGERLANLMAIADTALNRLSADELLAEMIDRVRTVLEADTVAVLLLDEGSDHLITRASHGLNEQVGQGMRVPVGVGFAGSIAATRAPAFLTDVNSDTVANPALMQQGVRSMLGAPIVRDEQVIGVLHVGRMDERVFTDEDMQLVMIAADRIAGAVAAQQLAAEVSAVELLERSLLPSRFPAVAGVQFASRYVAAADRTVGGDWYDAFTLPDGALWLVIGDVVGHGLRSAVVMSRVRTALRAYALLGGGPAQVLELTDRKVHHFEMHTMTTVLCAVAHPPYQTFEISSAGHLAPLLVRPGQDAEILDMDTDPPLGSVPDLARTSVHVDVPLGGVLLLYTDGLVEDRNSAVTDGMERLRRAMRADHPEVTCRAVMSAMVGTRIPDDDIALLAIRRVEVPE